MSSNANTNGRHLELSRMFRVADMLVTCHAILRDNFARRSLLLDIFILSCAAWLTAMSFVDPQVVAVLVPVSIAPQIAIGLVALAIFILSLIQLKVDWKGRSALHGRAAAVYGDLKSELGTLLANANEVDDRQFAAIREKYVLIGRETIPIPDSRFTRLKQKHKLKIEISKFIDQHPAANIFVLKCRLWWRDNRRKT